MDRDGGEQQRSRGDQDGPERHNRYSFRSLSTQSLMRRVEALADHGEEGLVRIHSELPPTAEGWEWFDDAADFEHLPPRYPAPPSPAMHRSMARADDGAADDGGSEREHEPSSKEHGGRTDKPRIMSHTLPAAPSKEKILRREDASPSQAVFGKKLVAPLLEVQRTRYEVLVDGEGEYAVRRCDCCREKLRIEAERRANSCIRVQSSLVAPFMLHIRVIRRGTYVEHCRSMTSIFILVP